MLWPFASPALRHAIDAMTRKSSESESAGNERDGSSLVEMIVATIVGVTLGLSTGNYALGIGVGIGTGILMIIFRALLWRLRDRRKGGA